MICRLSSRKPQLTQYEVSNAFWKATGVFMSRDSILLCEEKDDLLPFEMSRLVPNMK